MSGFHCLERKYRRRSAKSILLQNVENPLPKDFCQIRAPILSHRVSTALLKQKQKTLSCRAGQHPNGGSRAAASPYRHFKNNKIVKNSTKIVLRFTHQPKAATEVDL